MVNLTEDKIFHVEILYLDVDKVDNFVDKSKNSEKISVLHIEVYEKIKNISTYLFQKKRWKKMWICG